MTTDFLEIFHTVQPYFWHGASFTERACGLAGDFLTGLTFPSLSCEPVREWPGCRVPLPGTSRRTSGGRSWTEGRQARWWWWICNKVNYHSYNFSFLITTETQSDFLILGISYAHPSWTEVSFLVWTMTKTTCGTYSRSRRLKKCI